MIMFILFIFGETVRDFLNTTGSRAHNNDEVQIHRCWSSGAVVTSYVIYQVYSGSKKKKKKRTTEKRNHKRRRFPERMIVKELDGLDTKVQLELYGLFKQATKGNCTTPQPWASDFRGRAKWDAWKKNKT